MRRWYQIKSTEARYWAFLLWPALLIGPVGWQPAIAEAAGEADGNYYAFRYLSRPAVPPVRQVQRVQTPIDAFILSRLEAVDLTLSAAGARTALIRRTYLDLVGLPPTPEEVSEFLTDDTPGAYERLVDRLLGSPHFGEKWGQHWLDAAGYVDVYGADENAPSIRIPEGGWKYRDYVVQSFNDDKPYDRFIVEQLAGDELFDWREAESFTEHQKQLLIATGFLRTAIDDSDQAVLLLPSNFWTTLFDQVQIFGSCVMGLTLQCARCHSHKYDPLSQEDYFKLTAHFTPAYNPDNWVPLHNRAVADVPPRVKREIDKHNTVLDEQLKQELDTVLQPVRDRLQQKKLAVLPEAIRADVREAIDTPRERRSAVQEFLVDKFGKDLEVSAEAEVNAELTADEKDRVEKLSAEVTARNGTRESYGWIQALYDVGSPHDTRVLVRGDYEQPGEAVRFGLPTVLEEVDPARRATALQALGNTSGRRLEFAGRLTDPKTRAGALVARVMVNRTWHHLFSRGIVATPGNLGRSGDPPTHPLLLEWLASELVEGGWRPKPLVKKIVMSSVYQQASAAGAVDPALRDPDNHLLWRMPLKRMDAEIVRDAILATSGKLNPAAGGPSVALEVRADGEVVVAVNQATPTNQWRRTIYITSRRNYHPTMLGSFDTPIMATNCTQRNRSTVVTQSLALLNDQFMIDQADHFAGRVLQEAGKFAQARIDRAFRIAYLRSPTTEESLWAATLLLDQQQKYEEAGVAPEDGVRKALANLCHMLLCSNEFLYVE